MRKIFRLSIGKIRAHNTLKLSPVNLDVRVIDIQTTGLSGEKVSLLPEQIKVSSPTSIRYDSISSSDIFVEIEARYVDDLNFDDLLVLEIGLSNYRSEAHASFPKQRMGFSRTLSLVSEIDGGSDFFMQGNLGIRTLDHYGNIIYNEDISIGLGPDGEMVHYSESGGAITLPIEPKIDSIRVLVEGCEIEEFTVSGRMVTVNLPVKSHCHIVFKPFFFSDGGFHQINENISINSNYEIKLRNDHCSFIDYTLGVDIYDIGQVANNKTPVIKLLALVASDK